jgi:hypothetical protein
MENEMWNEGEYEMGYEAKVEIRNEVDDEGSRHSKMNKAKELK